MNTSQNKFGFTEKDIESIWQDIENKFPLLASPAIRKLLSALGFQEVHEDPETNKLILEVNQYEVATVKATKWLMQGQEVSVIRMSTQLFKWEDGDMFQKFSTALRSLFPDKNISFTLEELNASVNEHGIYPGDRDANNGKPGDIGGSIYSWLDSCAIDIFAPCAWRFRNGSSGSSMGNRRFSLCLVPGFK